MSEKAITKPERSERPSLILTEEPNTLLISLRKDVLYVILTGPGAMMGKLIDLNNIRNTFKPNNETAAVFLYMLARGDTDPVLLSDYLAAIGRDPEVKDFLTILDQQKVLQITKVLPGTQGGQDLDPKALLATVPPGQTPGLITGGPANVKAKVVYTSGWGPVIIPR